MQDRIFLSPPFVGSAEHKAVNEAVKSGYIAPCGPFVDAFENKIASYTYLNAAAVSSGTAAMDLLMAEFNVGPERPIIASTLTFIASVAPAAHRGANLTFVDSDPCTGTISLPLLKQALSKYPVNNEPNRKKPIVIAVDIYGQCCNYSELRKLCDEYDALLIIDAAESFGAHYSSPSSDSNADSAGHYADAVVYSFNGNKIITTSGGGAVVSRNSALINRVRWLATQAKEKAIYYEHKELGYNYRLSNISAAIGCAQIDRLDDICKRKKRNYEFYCNLFESFPKNKRPVPFPCDETLGTNHWMNVFIFPTVKQRNATMKCLEAANIESRPVWKPMHLQPVFTNPNNDFKVETCYGGSVAEDWFNRGLCLPSGAGLTRTQLKYIGDVLKNILI